MNLSHLLDPGKVGPNKGSHGSHANCSTGLGEGADCPISTVRIKEWAAAQVAHLKRGVATWCVRVTAWDNLYSLILKVVDLVDK
jgi:hypothetical protein